MRYLTRNKRGSVGLAGVIIVIVIISAGAYYWYNQDNGSTDDSGLTAESTAILYTEGLEIVGHGDLKNKVVDGTQINMLYHIATIYEFPLVELMYIRPGQDVTMTSSWGSSSSSSYSESVNNAISSTTGSNWTLGAEISMKNFKVSASHTWINETTNSVAYETTLQKEISESKEFSITVNPKDWDVSKYYRVECVAQKCEVYQRVNVDKITGEETIDYMLEISERKYVVLQHSDIPDFPIPENLYINYKITNYDKDITSTDRIIEKGNGTINSPYLVTNEGELKEINNNLGAYFKLCRNIELKSIWTPIGDSGSGAYKRFTGNFDGNGYKITGLKIEGKSHVNSGNAWAGMFAMIDGGVIKSLTLSVDISMQTPGNTYSLYVGGITGYLGNGILERCIVNGKIVTTERTGDVFIGGLAGKIENSTIESSINNSNIFGYGYTIKSGGIAGISQMDSKISYCVNTGNATSYSVGTAYSGGILGRGESTTVDRCVSSGKMETFANGFIFIYRDSAGIIANSNNCVISNCYYLAGSLFEEGNIQKDVPVDGGDKKGISNTTASSLDDLKKSWKYNGWDQSKLKCTDGRLPYLV